MVSSESGYGRTEGAAISKLQAPRSGWPTIQVYKLSSPTWPRYGLYCRPVLLETESIVDRLPLHKTIYVTVADMVNEAAERLRGSRRESTSSETIERGKEAGKIHR